MEHEDVTARCSSSNGTAPNKPSQDRAGETNGRSIPQRSDSKNPFEGRTTHFTDDLWTCVSIITFIADVGTDLLVCIKYYREKNLWWFSLTLAFLLLASFAMQVFSAKWLLEDGKRQHCFTYLLHVIHLGPVQRYWNVLKCGWKARQKKAGIPEFAAFLAEWRDISMLRLLQAFLESAPQLVLQLYILLQRPRFWSKDDLLTTVAAACSLVSMIWAILAYSKSLRDFRKQGYVLSAAGLCFQTLWRISMVTSRVVAMVLFASYFKQWLFVAVGAHWMIMTTWLICQRTRFCTDEDGKEHPCREKLFSAVIGFIYIFCFFNTREGMTRKRVVLFYSIILVENSLFVSMWYPHRTFRGIMSIAALGVVWGGLVFGIVCMMLYYRFYHPSLPVRGIFLQKRSFDLEGEKTHTWVCCCCCRVRSSRGRNTALDQNAAEGLIRNVNRSENHHPALELEILPRTLSWELIQEGSYAKGNHFQRMGAYDPDSPANILVHSTPARPWGMSSHPLVTSRLPRITVTGATPEVMSPRDSVSNSSLVTLNEFDMEAPVNVVQRPDQSASAADSVKTAAEDGQPAELDSDKKTSKARRGLGFEDDVTYTSPKSPTAGEIISWFHPEQSGCEASLDVEENKTEKINYGSLSFGNRYSLVSSDCISLSSESSRSSMDSIVFADEGPGSSGVCIKKTPSGEFTPRAMDEGIFSDERDSPAKASVPEDADTSSEPSTPQTSRVNAQFPALATNSNQDTFKEVQPGESTGKWPALSNTSDEDNFELVELLMDAPPSPLSSKKRRKREAASSLSSEEKASVESKPSSTREGSVSEQEDGHESESTDASSDSNYRRNRHRSCDEIETGASGVPSSPEEINKRHTFDFSQLTKSPRSPRKRRDRKHRRSKRREFDNFVVTALRPGKYGSLRRSIDRLAKIQEDTEETFLLNTEAALNACIPEGEELSSPSHDTSVLQVNTKDDSPKKQELNCSADSSSTYAFDPQENSMVSERENFMKRKRIKRFLSKELVPGKFSSVRLSFESGTSDENFEIFRESEFSGRPHQLTWTVSADSLPSRHSHRSQRTSRGYKRKEFSGKTVSLPDVIRSTGSKRRREVKNNPDLEKTITNRIKTSPNAILVKYAENSARHRDLVPVFNKRHTYDFTSNSSGKVETREQLFNADNGKRSAEDRHQRRSQSEVLIGTRTSSVYV
ncbi:hypothetical protein ACROYT_G009560 [Oculina patagonica]